MMLYPQVYKKSVKEITWQMIQELGIKGIILDVDNTLIDYNKTMPDGIQQWCEELKQHKIKFCIVSNSNKKDKVKSVADKLKIPYFYFAKKQLKLGFKRAKEILQLPESEIAVVGDQIFTDILGANRCHMISILVDPIQEKDIWITVLKRPIENKIKKKFQEKMEQSNRK